MSDDSVETGHSDDSVWDKQYRFFMEQQIEVSLFLANGIRLNGLILKFDDSAVVLTSEHGNPEGVTTARGQVATLMRRPPSSAHHEHQGDARRERTNTTRR